jgi:hypothetical protein
MSLGAIKKDKRGLKEIGNTLSDHFESRLVEEVDVDLCFLRG